MVGILGTADLRAAVPTRRILSPVNRQHDDVFSRCPKIQGVWKTGDNSTPRLASHSRKCQRTFNDSCDRRIDARAKLVSESCSPCLVPRPDV